MVRFATVRFLVALAAKFDLELDQMDVGNAFVTSALDTDELYMEVPPLFKYLTSGTVSSQNIRFKFVPTTEQQADIMTKSLPAPAVLRFTDLVFGIAHFATVSCAHGFI